MLGKVLLVCGLDGSGGGCRGRGGGFGRDGSREGGAAGEGGGGVLGGVADGGVGAGGFGEGGMGAEGGEEVGEEGAVGWHGCWKGQGSGWVVCGEWSRGWLS